MLGSRFLYSVLKGNVFIGRGVRDLMDGGDFEDVPDAFMLIIYAPEILGRRMFFTILIFDSAVSGRSVIVDYFPVVRDYLARFLDSFRFQR